MANNHMEEIAKLLGVELGEKFIVKNYERTEEVVLCKGGLFVCSNGEETYNPKLFAKILCGVYEIWRKPWEPKEGEIYYCPAVCSRKVLRVTWHFNTHDYALKALGMVYRTKEEAEANLSKDYEKLTGKKLEG